MVACSLHFAKTDFIQSKSAGSKVLKQNAVPSRNLPKRKRVVDPIKDKPSKKLFKPSDRQKTMTDQVDGDPDVVQEEKVEECRACLKKLDYTKSICYVFQAWSPPWKGMEATIAEDLAKLANVEVSITDRHSKVICSPCYQSLLDAAKFAVNVRGSDLRLRQRFTDDIDIEKVWPKPIQVDNINRSVFTNTLDVEIKQEVVSDEEQTDAFNVSGTENAYADTELSNVDIKIEPEEMVESPPMNITINGTISLNPLNSEIKTLTNGTDLYHDDRFLETTVKQEPMSEEEEVEQVLDMPLECLLCTKSFNSVTGLKAHVIAHHSYKSVKRKADGSVSPEKKRSDRYQCAICRRSFQTSTDLMVHETCHNKHSCYGCTKKFDTFELLTRHRKQCKSITNSTPKLKTLGDVKRTRPEVRPETLVVEIENRIELPIEADSEMTEAKSESIEGKQDESLMIEIKEEVDSSMKLHLEIHSAETGKETAISDGGLQVETLKNDDCL